MIGYALSSRAAYSAALRQWGQWLVRHGLEPLAVKPANVRAFLGELEDRSPGAIELHRVALRNFYEYAYEQDLIAATPVPQGKPPNRAANPRVATKRMSDNAIRRRLEELTREAAELEAELERRG